MQVLDDPKLLKLMLEDTKQSSDYYKPTNYWEVYEKVFLPELEKMGLHDFRRRKNSILSSFGATDLAPTLGQVDLFQKKRFYNSITKKIPFWSKILSSSNNFLNKILPISTTIKKEEFEQLFYEFACMHGEKAGAKSIEEFEASLFGNPEDVIKRGDKVYTISILNYYLQYVYCCKYIDFKNIKIIVELGGGSGKQIEVIKKLHPKLCFLIFEIPPQLYVCEQYLKQVFPNDVISYRETRNMHSIPEGQEGKIYIFGNWKFPILENIKIDLFWNSASFQEMEPEVVENYLKYVNKQSTAIYLQEVMKGKEIAKKEGHTLPEVELRKLYVGIDAQVMEIYNKTKRV